MFWCVCQRVINFFSRRQVGLVELQQAARSSRWRWQGPCVRRRPLPWKEPGPAGNPGPQRGLFPATARCAEARSAGLLPLHREEPALGGACRCRDSWPSAEAFPGRCPLRSGPFSRTAPAAPGPQQQPPLLPASAQRRNQAKHS